MFAIKSGSIGGRLRWGMPALAGALIVPLALVPGGGTEATYGGQVGRLSFAMDVGGNVDVYSARADGSGLRRLTTGPGFDACAAYDPSGRNLAFCSDRSGALEIWTMRANGQRQHQLTHLGGSATFPDFSPSGRLVAFGGTRDPDRPNEIWRVRHDGTHLQRLTYTPHLVEEFPVWRPGHAQIAFLRPDVALLGTQLWIMRADGSHQRPLTLDDTVKDQLPDWSPDGRRLAYAADGDIWVMRADGSHQRNLTRSADEEFGAAWSPDGTRIAFVRDLGARRPIYTMAVDGTDQQVLLPGSTDRQFVPGWQPVPTRPDCTPRIRDLGTLPGGQSSEVLGMNGHGLVVGSARNARGVERAVVWQGGHIRDLGRRGDALAMDVNDAGVVVGTFAEEDGEGLSGHVFRWRAGHGAETLPGIGGSAEWARRINERGEIVGSALGTDGREHPVMWRHGRPYDLGIPAGYEGAIAAGVNDAGDAVGAAYIDFEQVAWVWTAAGGSHPLDRRGSFSAANVIDDRGRAAGLSDFGGNPGVYAALWSGQRRVAPLGVFGESDYSHALATSGRGDFAGIGDYFAGEGVGHAFLRRVETAQAVRAARSPLRTLMPLSGDPADHSNVHALLRDDPPLAPVGSVTAGGHSATAGGAYHATLWTCAYQQSFIPDDRLTDPPRGAPTHRESPDLERLRELVRE